MRNKEFIPYEQALALQQLGFNEECFGTWFELEGKYSVIIRNNLYGNDLQTPSPLYQQAFRWFREQYWYTALILCDSFQIVMQLSTSKTLDSKTGEYIANYSTQTYHKEEGLKSYDESELACLKQLIEIMKGKNNEQR